MVQLIVMRINYAVHLTVLFHLDTVEPPMGRAARLSTFSSTGAALLLAGCFSAEPFSSSGCYATLQKKQKMIQCHTFN